MAHNVLYYNSSDGAITQFGNTDVAQLSEYVLELMAANTYAGTITVGNTNPIGTFVDTVRVGGVGSNDVTILSNTYTLSQVNTVQSTTDPPMYLGLQANSSSVIIQENLTTLNDLADEIIQSLISDYGVNSYYLGASPPSDGGTWVSRGTLTDTLENFTVTNSTYQLWHKVTSAAYASYKAPLKLGASSEILQWTEADVQNLIKKVEERIVATGIGSYSLQSTAPVTGTWVSAGEISDVRRVVNSSVSYTGEVQYSATFDIGSFTGTTPVNYSGAVSYTADTTIFLGTAPINYSGAVAYTGVTTIYTGGPDNFVSYLGPLDYTGSDVYTGTAGDFQGPVFTSPDFLEYTSSEFLAFGGPFYLGPTDYTASRYTEDVGGASFEGAPIALYNNDPAGIGEFYQEGPTSPWYVGTGGAIYEGGVDQGYSSAVEYTLGIFYTANYLAPDTFSGPATFTGPDGAVYNAANPNLYTGPDTFINPNGITYAGTQPSNYTGPSLFTNPDGITFAGTVPANYTGPTDYTGADLVFTSPTYSGPVDYSGTATYDGPTFVQPTYSGPLIYATPSTYTGAVVNYTGLVYSGPTPTSFTTTYQGTTPADYTGQYSGDFPFDSDTIYLGPGEGAYLGGNYIGPNFTQYDAGPGLSESYVGTAYNSTNYGGPPIYSGTVGFTNPTPYTGFANFSYDGTYDSVNPDGTNYTSMFSGPGLFAGADLFYTSEDANLFAGNYQGSFTAPANFTNINGASFTGSYTGPVAYTGPTAASYEGAIYTNENVSFEGVPVVSGTTETISSVTLWKRVA